MIKLPTPPPLQNHWSLEPRTFSHPRTATACDLECLSKPPSECEVSAFASEGASCRLGTVAQLPVKIYGGAVEGGHGDRAVTITVLRGNLTFRREVEVRSEIELLFRSASDRGN